MWSGSSRRPARQCGASESGVTANAAIEQAGYSAITPVVVTNHRRLADVVALTATGEVAVGDPVLDATAKATETV